MRWIGFSTGGIMAIKEVTLKESMNKIVHTIMPLLIIKMKVKSIKKIY